MTRTSDEQVLSGGNINAVVRVGETVRRQTGAHSGTIHEFLLHLENKGFPAPRYLGIDESGREILSFVEGETEFPSDLWTNEEPLVGCAGLLRQFHDASLDFVPPDPASWAYLYPGANQRQVICHNDFAPYNMVFRNGQPIAVLDFDLCGPGPRSRDLAYLAYWMTPLSFALSALRSPPVSDAVSACRRLRLLCETYGGQRPLEILPMVSDVLHHMGDEAAATRMVGAEASGRLKSAGHFDHWASEAAAFDGQLDRLIAEL
jgi:hypothetical protein